MLIGVEYVVAAYLSWICTFAVYIFMTKRRMKISGQTIDTIKQRLSESSDKPEKTVSIENQN